MSSSIRRLSLLLLAAAALLPAAAMAGERIVGGHPAARTYPHQGLLEIDFGVAGQARCAGSLVAARYMVTAAHCMSNQGNPPQHIDVTLGSSDVAGKAPNFIAVSYLVNPNYTGDPGGGSDVALLKLDKAADFDQVRLLRPADTAMWQPGTTATVIGWGKQEDDQPVSDQLLEVQVPVFSDAACDADFQAASAPAGFFKPLTMVCAGGKEGRDSCQGDSGGPMLVPDGARFAIAGVVSFGAVLSNGDGCANGLPGIYTRIAADPLNGWIRSNIPQVEIDPSPAQPEPGQPVALRASGNNPINGAYTSYAWDLDNDGLFDDASGPDASITPARGLHTVGVLASRLEGTDPQRDREVRRIDLDARFRSPVSFANSLITVVEGQPITLVVNKSGGGSGAANVTPTAGTATLGVDIGTSAPAAVSFGSAETTHTITIPTVDDKLVEQPETFRLDLTNFGGDLLPGSPGQVNVTINDNDVVPKIKALTKSAKVKKGKITLKGSLNTPATVTLGLTSSNGRTVYAAARKKITKAGTFSVTVKLRKAATKALRKKRTVKARAVYAVFDGDDLLDSKVVKFTLKR
jgi:secreted trypsin-like serine protease